MTGAARDAVVRAMIVAFGVSAPPGCALLPPANIQTQKEMLNPALIDIPQRRNCATTLMVFTPQARPIYDTTQMAYAIEAHQVAYYGLHEWGETPSQMLHALLISTLQGTHCFNAVVTPPYPYAATYSLHTEIIELLQDFTAQPAVLRLALRVQLGDDATGQVMASKEITAHEPVRSRTPEAGVAAANAATAQALHEVVRFVLSATSSARSRP